MLHPSELEDLPLDNEEAFVEFRRKIWNKTKIQLEDENRQDWYLERIYFECLFEFDSVFGTHFMAEFRRPPTEDNEMLAYFRSTQARLDAIIVRLALKSVHQRRVGVQAIVSLNDGYREKVHFHISRIRSALQEAEIDATKRDSLLDKLNIFARDVDRSTTRLDALMSMALEMSDAAGKMAENLKPVKDLIEPLFRTLQRSRSEQVSLSGPEQRRQIEGPKGPPSDKSETGPEF